MKKEKTRQIMVTGAGIGFATLLIYMFSHFGVIVLYFDDLLKMYACILAGAYCFGKALTSKDMLKGDRKTLFTISGISVAVFILLLLSKTRFVIRLR